MTPDETTRMYIALCHTCLIAERMKVCHMCKFNIGLEHKSTNEGIIPDMTHDEMRLCRRELINECLQGDIIILHEIKYLVRNWEMCDYGRELKAYK